MHFDDFLKYAPKILNVSLPAIDAHLKMVPPHRIEFLKNIDLSAIEARQSAVLMLCYPKNSQAHLALILRTPNKGVHSAQVAFPGGKVETDDADLQATALRETYEEIGVPPDKVNVVRSFTEVYIPPSNFMVYPFLGICEEELEFQLQDDEVAGIIELPFKDIMDEKLLSTKIITTSYAQNILVPGFKVDDYFIWGATAMMMSELKETLKLVI